MVGRCISYWNSPFWGDMLVFGGVSDLVLPLWNIVLCGHVRCMVSKGEYLTSALAAKGFFSPSKNIVLPTSAGSPLKEFGKHWNTLVFTNIAGWNIPIFNRIQKFDSVRVHFQASYVSLPDSQQMCCFGREIVVVIFWNWKALMGPMTFVD